MKDGFGIPALKFVSFLQPITTLSGRSFDSVSPHAGESALKFVYKDQTVVLCLHPGARCEIAFIFPPIRFPRCVDLSLHLARDRG